MLTPAVRAYLAHTIGALSLRELARIRCCHASTVMRQIRRIELRRDDPLFDDALDATAQAITENSPTRAKAKDWIDMLGQAAKETGELDAEVAREARRILRRLCEKDAFLAVAKDMEKAVVIRETIPGRHTRTAVVSRDVAQKFALLDWIEPVSQARISRYAITAAGRGALKRLLEQDRQEKARRAGLGDKVTPFQAQHQDAGDRPAPEPGPGGRGARLRVNLAESPLTILGRKLDRNGLPFLSGDLIEAGERLREDFEVAQMGPRVTQNWDNFLAHGDISTAPGDSGGHGPEAARARVSAALAALGPGLSDVAFRVCCFLEGLETAEKRLGWSARSGKVVLRIALQRLARHYGITAGAERIRSETENA